MSQLQGCWPAEYQPGSLENLSALDPNHTHFILVDDGTQHKFEGEIGFRSKIEKHVSQMKTIGGEGRSLIVIATELCHFLVTFNLKIRAHAHAYRTHET